jgi:hypothetical protein
MSYSLERTHDIKLRRLLWAPSGMDDKTDRLCSDACGQLEMAQDEIDRLTLQAQSRESELQKHREEAELAWEVATAHHFPEEYSEINREEQDEDWEEAL